MMIYHSFCGKTPDVAPLFLMAPYIYLVLSTKNADGQNYNMCVVQCRQQRKESGSSERLNSPMLSPPLYLTVDISNIKFDMSLQVTSLFNQSNASIACLNRLSWRRSLWEGTSQLSNVTSLQR